jgi:NAD(P)-dependent dehydrogenase (short-subunit alcohol dehydrogenase family)
LATVDAFASGPTLEGKAVLITGAASGIGRATAILCGRLGASLVLADRNREGAEETARLCAGGTEPHVVVGDVTSPADAERWVERVVERFGRLDCAFNGAGIEGGVAPTHAYPRDDWREVIAVNLDGVFHCMQAELRQMARQGSGSIVNAASMLGVMGYTNLAAYNAAKHAVVGLTRTAALEYAPLGIRVNAVCPGFIETPMVMERGVAPASDPQVWRALADLHPMQRLGKPGEVAAAIAWLCSDASSFVTGHPLVIDGGMTAGRRGIHGPADPTDVPAEPRPADPPPAG